MSLGHYPLPVNPIKPNPNVLSRKVGDEVVLFHLETDKFYELNGTAARFWELLAAESDANRICEQMLKEFEVNGQQMRAEAGSLIASFQEEKLVTSHA